MGRLAQGVLKGEIIYTITCLRSFDMALHKEARGDWAEFRANVRMVFDCQVVTEKIERFVANDPRCWRDTRYRQRRLRCR